MEPQVQTNWVGLSDEEVASRLRAEGPNALPSEGAKKWFRLLLEVLTEPMLLLLSGCAVLYRIFGEVTEAILLSVFVVFVMVVTFYQERRAENALSALKKLAAPWVRVLRSGQVQKVGAQSLVREDILLLGEGDRVPADALVVQSTNLLVDESLLTGESVPVQKTASGSDAETTVSAGTLVVRGQAVVRVVATGVRTQMGQLGKSMADLDLEVAPLKKQIQKLVRRVVVASVLVCGTVFLVYALKRGDWRQGMLSSLSLAMSLLPEELPMILTIFFALGAWRMAKDKVLTRRAHAIETLGAATVLCVDKTGTLTYNKMQVQAVVTAAGVHDVSLEAQGALPAAARSLLHVAAQACQDRPTDPMDAALQAVSVVVGGTAGSLHREYPMTPQRLAFVYARAPLAEAGSANPSFFVAAKGAPETIFRLCRMDEKTTARWLAQVAQQARQGLRVLGVAHATWGQTDLPGDPEQFSYQFDGLVCFLDPVREEAKETIATCHRAGIRVVMLTGDHPQTALAIARQAGLSSTEETLTGTEIEVLTEPELVQKLRSVQVCSRVSPQQKLRLVQLLKSMGEVVAMTGDGVNDAPALKAAHIGIAMGDRGTDVAREAAALVLLDDRISSWVSAIRLGRRIFDNIRKALGYTIAVHLPIAGLGLFPTLLGWELVLFPAHIAMLEMIIDPVCSLVFESDPPRRDILDTPPRLQKEPILSKKVLLRSILEGLWITLACVAMLIGTHVAGHSSLVQRAAVFTTLILSNVVLVLVQRTGNEGLWATLRQRNRPFWWISGGAVVFLAIILYLPWASRLFHLQGLTWRLWALCLGAVCLNAVVLWGIQRVGRKKTQHSFDSTAVL